MKHKIDLNEIAIAETRIELCGSYGMGEKKSITFIYSHCNGTAGYVVTDHDKKESFDYIRDAVEYYNTI